jgi:exopolyphosphatase/guanosine-5'-triphosphate,3'-diphosphate pyrophosphatase
LILAAIDIGSNAARLLIQEVTIDGNGHAQFTKLNLIRFPLRLGMDVFAKGIISVKKKQMTLDAMQVYATVMQMYGVQHYRACATSAMRDARNGKSLIKLIAERTGIQIEIISGSEEAQMVYENHFETYLNHDRAYLYIDVGGGSTELTLINKQKVQFKESFNIGTIRLLSNQITTPQWNAVKNKVKTISKDVKSMIAIGSGGNINKVFSLSKVKENKPLTLSMLETDYKDLQKLTIDQRMQIYKLREDRADVIVPALKIYIQIMKAAGIEEIYVPKIGVADGIIKALWRSLQY